MKALEIFGTIKSRHFWEWLSKDLERILETIQPIFKIYGVARQSSISMLSYDILCNPASILGSCSTRIFFSWGHHSNAIIIHSHLQLSTQHS